jgi:hypothetical protein
LHVIYLEISNIVFFEKIWYKYHMSNSSYVDVRVPIANTEIYIHFPTKDVGIYINMIGILADILPPGEIELTTECRIPVFNDEYNMAVNSITMSLNGSTFMYSNSVKLDLNLQEIDYMKNFSNDYLDKIDPERTGKMVSSMYDSFDYTVMLPKIHAIGILRTVIRSIAAVNGNIYKSPMMNIMDDTVDGKYPDVAKYFIIKNILFREDNMDNRTCVMKIKPTVNMYLFMPLTLSITRHVYDFLTKFKSFTMRISNQETVYSHVKGKYLRIATIGNDVPISITFSSYSYTGRAIRDMNSIMMYILKFHPIHEGSPYNLFNKKICCSADCLYKNCPVCEKFNNKTSITLPAGIVVRRFV